MRIIAGDFKGRKLQAPKGSRTRPTTDRAREAVFSMLQPYLQGATFLDLFAGSGAVGLEAISRGAVSSTFVEKDKGALACLMGNIASLDAKECTEVLSGDVFKFLALFKKRKRLFDLIYADPPYGSIKEEDDKMPPGLKVLYAIDAAAILAPGGILLIEERKPLAFNGVLKSLTFRQCRRYGLAHVWQFERRIHHAEKEVSQ